MFSTFLNINIKDNQNFCFYDKESIHEKKTSFLAVKILEKCREFIGKC